MSGGARQRLVAFLSSPFTALTQFGATCYCLDEYFIDITTLAGPSMLPTFNRGSDIALTDRLTPRLWGVNRGDVVVTRTPQNVNQIVCKRIIATAGEIVLVKSKQWYMGTRKVKVPVGHVWIEGDNPNNSTDSRMYGPVPLALLQGRVVVKVRPSKDSYRVQIAPFRGLLQQKKLS